MARTVRDTNLESRTARLRLPPSDKKAREPYWRTIEQGAHVGYYKGSRGGTWYARTYLGGKYRKTTLGTADDVLDADGVSVLSFGQAQAIARTWFSEEGRRAAGLSPVARGPYTVTDAMADYLSWFEKHRKSHSSTKAASDLHITAKLGDIEISKLSTARIREWHEKLALIQLPKDSASASLTAKKIATAPQKPSLVDATRKRRSTANRVLTILKAALNHAWREGKVSNDDAWRRAKPYRGVDEAVVRYLSAAECKRLVNSAGPDFKQLIRAALLTGCRYGELVAFRTHDYQDQAGTISVRESKSGKSRHVVLTDEGKRFFNEATAGKLAGDLIFLRSDGKSWGKSHQQRPLAEACKHAKISPAVSFHVLRHTYGSLLAMQGVPLAVVAKQLGHSDTRMTERHYAHLAQSYVSDTVRQNFPTLDILDATKTVQLNS